MITNINIGPSYPISNSLILHVFIKCLIKMVTVLVFYHDINFAYYPYDI